MIDAVNRDSVRQFREGLINSPYVTDQDKKALQKMWRKQRSIQFVNPTEAEE